jgi:hypothetical protein
MVKPRKTRPKPSRVPELPPTASDSDVTAWATRHDVLDRVETGVSRVEADHADLDRLLEDSVHQDNSAQLNMRIPRAMKALLARLARALTTDATTLARIWLAERIQRELRASPDRG